MTWVKLDDRWDEHPKMLRVGDLGRLMWVCGLTYSARNLSDGFIPFEAVARLTSLRAWKPLASKLVQAGLWELADGGYAIHDYQDYQPLRAEVDASRESHVRRTKEWRCRSRDASRDVSRPHLGDGAVTLPRPDPVPSRSRPEDPEGEGEPRARRSAPSPRGTRITPDWRPDDPAKLGHGLRLTEAQVVDALPNFVDVFLAANAKVGVKNDWDAALRVFLRREIADGKLTQLPLPPKPLPPAKPRLDSIPKRMGGRAPDPEPEATGDKPSSTRLKPVAYDPSVGF